MTLRFGPFLADRTTYRVTEDGRTVELTPKLLDLLFFFLERPATLVTKEALLDAVWPGANVTDNALAQAVSELREALGDRPAAPKYIKTVARRGYRFVAPVTTDAAPEKTDAGPGSVERADTGTAEPRRGVVVMDFDNVTGDADVAWLSAGIAETVANDLAALGPFKVIDRWSVVQARRRGDGSMHEMGAAFGAGLAVVGSFQRSGATLRITARVVDLATGEGIADAKVDGPLDQVFALQDAVVASFAAELGAVPARRAGRRAGHETTSLEAYRAYTEGWLKIESLDTDQVAASIRDFDRAIQLDPRYALAHTGLANAAFVAYEMTRALREPDIAARTAGLDHARHAIELDPDLAEAHATLSFLLSAAGLVEEARAAALRAVAIEPDSWRHQYRLGHASWGSARLRAFDRAAALYPGFPYTHFEASMVHVARGHLQEAEEIARLNVADEDRQARSGNRFPAIGFHWLLGAIAASRGDHEAALEEFDRELAQCEPRRLYGPEYGALARVGQGQAQLALGRLDDALGSFRGSLERVPRFGRARLGEAVALTRLGDRRAAASWLDVEAARADLERTGRLHEALHLSACADASRGDLERSVGSLAEIVEQRPAGHPGWTMPIEPFFRPLQGNVGFAAVLGQLATLAM